ncbi:MAG: hypothetical protein Tsb0019_42330 [Roseibium sp.]
MDASAQTDAPEAAVADPVPTDLVVQAAMPDAVRSSPLTAALRRAVSVVRKETRALKENPTADLKAFEYGKSQALLDLTRARALVPPSAFTAELKAELAEFKEALEDNLGLLRLHMDAVSEVVGMMSKTMIDFDSDGTYQAPFPEPAR